jgi:hypothetical protein
MMCSWERFSIINVSSWGTLLNTAGLKYSVFPGVKYSV